MGVSTHVPHHSERAQPCPSTESQRYFFLTKCHCRLTLFCPHDILEERGRGEEARRRADSPPGRAEGEGTLLDPQTGPATEPGQWEGGARVGRTMWVELASQGPEDQLTLPTHPPPTCLFAQSSFQFAHSAQKPLPRANCMCVVLQRTQNVGAPPPRSLDASRGDFLHYKKKTWHFLSYQ